MAARPDRLRTTGAALRPLLRPPPSAPRHHRCRESRLRAGRRGAGGQKRLALSLELDEFIQGQPPSLRGA